MMQSTRPDAYRRCSPPRQASLSGDVDLVVAARFVTRAHGAPPLALAQPFWPVRLAVLFL